MARMRVYRSKHSTNHRPDGHFNWQVEDRWCEQRLVFSDFQSAVNEAHRLATQGVISPDSLVGCINLFPGSQPIGES